MLQLPRVYDIHAKLGQIRQAHAIIEDLSSMEDEAFTLKDGYLYCEEVRIKDLQVQLHEQGLFPPSPTFVYSKRKLISNIAGYQAAMADLRGPGVVSYSMKANATPALLKIIQSHGCWVTLVSGMELRMAITVGFQTQHIIFNGNGKQDWERKMAIEKGCLLNVDSCFDLCQTLNVCGTLNKTAKVLLRINPDIDPDVHPYISTGLAASKFGLSEAQVEECIEALQTRNGSRYLLLVGLHCHLGSTIVNTDVFRSCSLKLLEIRRSLQERGFCHIDYINIGGGLGIDYRRIKKSLTHKEVCKAGRTPNSESDDLEIVPSKQRKFPTPRDLIEAVASVMVDSGATLIVEPGRSLVADTAILAATVLGTKHNNTKNFIVTDAAMTEIIRPSLYGAYHHISLTEPGDSPENHSCGDKEVEEIVYDIVGPVCEGSDFIGRERKLPTPSPGCGLAVFDAGAYCSSMASNYNLRLRPCEILVDGGSWSLVRRPDSFSDILRPYEDL